MDEVHSIRLYRGQAQLLVVDLQEGLIPHIRGHMGILTQVERMIRAALTMEIPVTISEQYPRGLGPTVSAVSVAAEGAERCEKTAFSFCRDEACRNRITEVLRPRVLIVGIETHVCVQQTALDLLELQMQPFVLADAVGSRRELDHEVALERMRSGGVIVTTVESAIFQLVQDAGTELFKRILPLVK